MSEATTAPVTPAPSPQRDAPRFTEGSILRHVVVMSVTGGIGLMAIFVVDLLSLLYVSWLGSETKLAGVGFATMILFIAMSFNIGLMIGLSALVSKALGARDRERARRMAASGVAITVLMSALVGAGLLLFRNEILLLLNAKAAAAEIASQFLLITLPANVFMGFGMAYSAVLRSVGDARRAMYVTLGGGIATAFLDPLFIFGLNLDVMGAAWATVVTRLIFASIGYWGAVRVHDLVGRPSLPDIMNDAVPLAAIAAPAILTNLATPIGNAYLARVMAQFGDPAVAAGAVVDRLVPLAFGVLFALSGAVGPVLGQNWGAGMFGRMRRTLSTSMQLSTGYVLVMWLLLVVTRHGIVEVFHLRGEAAELVLWFCWISGPCWIGIGALFVANASFNNLGFPFYATAFNWGRVLLGTIPFAVLGAHYAGALGAMSASLAAGAIFGFGAAWVAYASLRKIALAGRMPAVRTRGR